MDEENYLLNLLNEIYNKRYVAGLVFFNARIIILDAPRALVQSRAL